MAAFHKALRFATIFFGVVVIFMIGWRLSALRTIRLSAAPAGIDYGTVADFSLTERSGRTIGRSDLAGHWWVADFVFTRCMGPCPTVTAAVARLQSEFAGEKNLRFVSFSVDPDGDTPDVLKKYAASYGADPDRWYFLTGSKTVIFDLIRGSFKLAIEPGTSTSGGLDIMHSLSLVLVDPAGHIRGYFNATDSDAVVRLKEELKKIP